MKLQSKNYTKYSTQLTQLKCPLTVVHWSVSKLHKIFKAIDATEISHNTKRAIKLLQERWKGVKETK